MHNLLTDDGTLYLHLDWRAVHYARMLLDEIFGPSNFINEIIWVYHGPSPVRSYFNRKHDTILAYGKGKNPCFFADRIRIPYHPSTHKTFQSSLRAGFGKQPDLSRGKVPEDWWYFPVVARLHNQRTGYPTQKPESLLERILLASSEEGDWIGDFFCGSGTTLRVADSLSRRWVGCDILPQSIAVCQRRFALSGSSSYSIEVLGDSIKSSHLSTLKVSVHKKSKSILLTLKDMSVCNPLGFPQSLDFWEVDFNYRDDVFRSLHQAARPWRKGSIPLQCQYTYSRPGKYRISVRALSSAGETAIYTIPISIP
jgi:DNA modification methylase